MLSGDFLNSINYKPTDPISLNISGTRNKTL